MPVWRDSDAGSFASLGVNDASFRFRLLKCFPFRVPAPLESYKRMVKMRGSVWILAGGILGIGIVGAAIGLQAEADRGKAKTIKLSPPPKAPRVSVDDIEHNFGYVRRFEECNHQFWIRNVGNAPLKLEKAGTSCKCTTSFVAEDAVPPGGRVPIDVALKVETDGAFSQTVTIRTNDPLKPELELIIHGNVRAVLAVDRPTVELPSMRPGDTRTEEVVVYSQVWDEFVLPTVVASSESMNWELDTLSPEKAEELSATAGYVVRVHWKMPEGEVGYWGGRLDLAGHPSDDPDARQTLGVSFMAPLRRPVELVGTGYLNELDFGVLTHGVGGRKRAVLIVRGEHPEGEVRAVEVEPKFLDVQIEPIEDPDSDADTYRIAVVVPRDAPPCGYYAKKGRVRIATGHPKSPFVEFNVGLAIRSPRER